MPRINTPWTEKDKKTLRDMWGKGIASGAIATKLGRSRSSVMGMISREGLQRYNTSVDGKKPISRAPKPKKPKTPKHKKSKVFIKEGKIAVGQPVLKELPETEYAPEGQKLYRLADLPARGCRWPFGDTRHKDGMWFCGKQQKSNSSYCCDHHTISKNDRALKPIRPLD